MNGESVDQHDRVAVVLGSGRPRVGRAIVNDLARQGYQVVLHANRSIESAETAAHQLRDEGHRAIALQADISSEVEVERFFTDVVRRLKRVDVVVNTASIWSPCRLEETTEQELMQNFKINAMGSFLCTQRAGLLMTQQSDGGVIINFGDASTDHPKVDYAAYYLSKSTIGSLTRTLAVELAQRNPNVRVNAIEPGSILLPPDASEEDREARRQATLVKRADDVEPVVQTVRFLIQNRSITGFSVRLDGGRSLRPNAST